MRRFLMLVAVMTLVGGCAFLIPSELKHSESIDLGVIQAVLADQTVRR